ncbi:MAG: putative ABC transport system ATP-binding protein [Planctomycetota bacterium]|jgi:putative ABC transport system ATP-binding protein
MRSTVDLAQVANPVIAQLADVERTYVRGSLEVLALHGIQFQLKRTEFVALTGHSGCGKSTLLNLISGVDRADGGEVVVCGQNLRTATETQLTMLRRRHIGVVFQDFQLMPNLTAAENVGLPLALDGRLDAARIDDLLARVGLRHRSTHYPSELSGGEQQRVAVARALVHRPALIVADEPTGNLDSTHSQQVLELLMELRIEESAALVLATHDLEIAAQADREVQLRDGQIVGVETR